MYNQLVVSEKKTKMLETAYVTAHQVLYVVPQSLSVDKLQT